MGRGKSSMFVLKEGVWEGCDRGRESSAGLNWLQRAEQRVSQEREGDHGPALEGNAVKSPDNRVAGVSVERQRGKATREQRGTEVQWWKAPL